MSGAKGWGIGSATSVDSRAVSPRIVTTAQLHNSAQSFKGSFLSIGAAIKRSADEPGFQFESQAPNPARNLVSVLGHEQNGVFFA
jgi:hypothetical protein